VRNEKVTLARPHPGAACRHHSFAGAFYLCRSAIRAARPGRCDGGKRGITGYHTGAVRHRHGGGALHLQDRADVCRARQTPGGACRRPGQGRTGARRDGAGRPRCSGALTGVGIQACGSGFARGRSPASLRANPSAPLRAIVSGALYQRGNRHHQAAGTADRRCRPIRRSGRYCPGTLRPRRTRRAAE